WPFAFYWEPGGIHSCIIHARSWELATFNPRLATNGSIAPFPVSQFLSLCCGQFSGLDSWPSLDFFPASGITDSFWQCRRLAPRFFSCSAVCLAFWRDSAFGATFFAQPFGCCL